jgi:hypothetical protein
MVGSQWKTEAVGDRRFRAERLSSFSICSALAENATIVGSDAVSIYIKQLGRRIAKG